MMKWWVITIKLLFLLFSFFSNCTTCWKASISSPLSTSSNKIYLGCNNLICNTSSFLLSQPLNHTLRSLRRNSLSMCNSSIIGSITFLNWRNDVDCPAVCASYIDLRNSNTLTHLISGICWNARNMPSFALSLGIKFQMLHVVCCMFHVIFLIFFSVVSIFQFVISYFGLPIIVMARDDLPEPFCPIMA